MARRVANLETLSATLGPERCPVTSRYSVRLIVTLAGVVLIALIGAYLLAKGTEQYIWIPLGLSVASLAISILAAFKTELFDFAPVVVGGDIMLAQGRPVKNNFVFVLPLHLVNEGYGSGVVEWISVVMVLPDKINKILFIPVAFVDLQKVIQGKRFLHAENLMGAFSSYHLESKGARTDSIVFSRQEGPGVEPFQLQPGTYQFEVYVKANTRRKPWKALTFEKELTQELFDQYLAGSSIYLSDLTVEIDGVDNTVIKKVTPAEDAVSVDASGG